MGVDSPVRKALPGIFGSDLHGTQGIAGIYSGVDSPVHKAWPGIFVSGLPGK